MGSSTFSKHDLKMIETSWSFVKDKKTLGLNTMIRLFETSEEIKEMFSFTTTSTPNPTNNNNNNRLIYHANQVIKSFDTIIILLTLSKNNNNDEQKKIDLIELGKLHYHAGIKKEYFKVNFYSFFFFCITILCFIFIIDI